MKPFYAFLYQPWTGTYIARHRLEIGTIAMLLTPLFIRFKTIW